MPTFKTTPTDQIIHECAMPLITIRDGKEVYVSGTAFLIGKQYAVTARHVLDDFISKYERREVEEGNIDLSFEILTFLTLEKGERVLPMKIMRAWFSKSIDLAVLALGVPEDLPSDHVWKIPALDLIPPKKGTPIVAFGFAETKLGKIEGSEHPKIYLHPISTTGEVQEVHHETRDSCRLTFPCFRTNARFDGGMSGGPVINLKTGHICGAICSSIPSSGDGEDHTSYVSSLWPLVGTLVDATPEAVATGNYYPLYDLFKKGVFFACDLSQVKILREADGRMTPEVYYDAGEWDKGI